MKREFQEVQITSLFSSSNWIVFFNIRSKPEDGFENVGTLGFEIPMYFLYQLSDHTLVGIYGRDD